MKIQKSISLFLLILLSFNTQAQEVYDLKRCIDTGLQQNYQIKIIKNVQQISDNNLSVGNAGYLPTLDLAAGYTGYLNDINQQLTDGTEKDVNNAYDHKLAAGVNLNWTVFDGFSIQTNYSKLKQLQQVGELNTRLTVENFVSDLSAEYYNYVRQNIRMKNLEAALDLSRERLRIVEARYSIGSMSKLDLQQARVDFNADSSNLITQVEILSRSRIRLNELMGIDNLTQQLTVKDTIILTQFLFEEKNLWQKTLEANSALLLAAKNKTLSELDYRSIKSRNYPYLKLNASYGLAWDKTNNAGYTEQLTLGPNYGLTLGYNLFDGMNRRREQRNARLQIDNKDLEYKQTELALKSDLSNMWIAYQNNILLVNLEKENLLVAKENYSIAIDRYKLGSLSGIELREAQNSLLEAEERLLLAQYNTKLCEISLLQITGQILKYIG